MSEKGLEILFALFIVYIVLAAWMVSEEKYGFAEVFGISALIIAIIIIVAAFVIGIAKLIKRE